MTKDLLIAAIGFVGILTAQAPPKVNFATDVQPIFRQNCVGCHGPSMQQAGLRLDRKSSVMKSFSRRVVPGNSANSFVYHRVSGTEYGSQMPPTGPLRPEQIAIVKAWIDQGADWPASLANEVDRPPVNPLAMQLVQSLSAAATSTAFKIAAADPTVINARGPEGSTPFMYAVVYSNVATLARFLKLGADPNKRNDAGATALMWAAIDIDKTRLLLDNHADVNAKSDDFRTPLMIAARRFGGKAIVKLLLDKGANPNPNAKPATESSPLLEALTAGDPDIVELLINRGADAKAAADIGLTLAVQMKCERCLNLLKEQITDKEAYTLALQTTAVFGDIKATRLMLDKGADVNAFDPLGRTPLMYAAISDLLPVDVVRLLMERGADVNAIDRHVKSGDAGKSVLDIARFNGDTSVSQLLAGAGAKATSQNPPALKFKRDNTIQAAVKASLPLIQRADAAFTANSGCISCHNNSLAAISVSLARKRGFQIDENVASAQVRTNLRFLESNRDKLHQGAIFPVADTVGEFIFAFLLLGLEAEGHKPDLNTDAAAMYILSRQRPNGEWPSPTADTRPPICLTYIGQSVLSMRALQLYAPKSNPAAYDKAIKLTASWLAKVQSQSNEDRSWRVIGLAWAATDRPATQKAIAELLAVQRSDGGWADLPTLPSSSYASGKSLAALRLAGFPTSDAAYQRGLKFLLNTQLEDGSWYTKTRALGFQPFFDADFPHGVDQWVSAAGTSWAAIALTLSLPEGGILAAR